MGKLSDIITWKKSFGLLPIHLNPIKMKNRFLMLNGGYGDFCLQTSDKEDNPSNYFSQSWSSNTKNYIFVGNNKIKIFNWIKENPEIISKKDIENNFSKFYGYLISKSYKTENDVVPFILDIFRGLRNLTQEKINSVEALNLLFTLLIGIEEDYKRIDTQKWNISTCNIPTEFDYYVNKMKSGFNIIKPQLDLILRHTSGILFQEAHKEVLFFDSQRDLFGGISSNLITRNSSYSSIHYTPQYLVRTIVENSINLIDFNKKSIKVFDPACGSSEFLNETLKQLKSRNYKGKITIIGWDTSESAINTSKFLLNYEIRTQWNSKNIELKLMKVNDSLSEEWDDDYDLILMNPPFISWELLNDKNSRDIVRNILKIVMKDGKPNQSSAFFYKAVESLGANGVIGCVVPSSILTYETYKGLRDNIGEMLTLKIIAKLGNFVFEDALADVCFIVGQKPKTNNVPQLIWCNNEKGNVQDALRDFRKLNANKLSTINDKGYNIYQPDSFPIVKNWKILSVKENNMLKSVENDVKFGKLTRIKEIFTVKQGLIVGNKMLNDKLILTDNEFLKLPKKERQYFRPVANSSSIKDGTLNIQEYIWYPYNKIGILFKSESKLKNLSFYKKVLKPNEKLLKSRKGIKEWWGLTRPRNWQFTKKNRLYSNRFGNSKSFTIDKTGDSVIIDGNAWIPKKIFERDDYYFYLSIFTSGVFDKLLSLYSRQLAGGQWFDLGANYTNNIPVPNVHIKDFNKTLIYSNLVDFGKEIGTGNRNLKFNIDDILYKYFYPKF